MESDITDNLCTIFDIALVVNKELEQNYKFGAEDISYFTSQFQIH
jgi:hypothetical protein